MSDPVKAGIGVRDITPELPVELAGMGAGNIAYDIESRLYAKAFTFQRADRRFSVVTCDVLGIDAAVRAEIETGVGERFGGNLEKYDLFISCSHTHWAPHLRTLWGGCKINVFYRRHFIGQVIEAVLESFDDCEPVKLYAGKTRCALNVNRRVIIAGRAFMLPDFPEFTYRADGPVDDGVNYLLIKKTDAALKGLLFNYSCHPICFPCRYDKISADYPGKTGALIAGYFNVPAGFINGGAGDVAPLGALKGKAIRDAVAEKIAEGIIRGVETGAYEELAAEPFLSCRFTSVFMPREETIARWNITSYEKGKSIAMPLGFWRLGEWICINFGGELFTVPEQRLKKSLPLKYVNIASYTDGYLGYLPPAGTYSEAGYEISAALVEEGEVERFTEAVRSKYADELKKL